MNVAEQRHLRWRLTEAEMHVPKADQLVERQRAMIEDLRRQRHDASAALRLLAQMELSQRRHLDDLDRLLRERDSTG